MILLVINIGTNNRINRYIMECKSINSGAGWIQKEGINRYIMECKSVISCSTHSNETELIDTLWNVNQVRKLRTKEFGSELIDTLWNVNSKIQSFLTKAVRINRYIMECKFIIVKHISVLCI